MRITRTDKILNVPLLKIRNFLRKYKDARYFTENEFSNYLIEPSPDMLQNVLSGMIVEGHIEKNYEGNYVVTQKGRSLCLAKCIKPLNKKEADKHFSDFMARVDEVNSNDDYFTRLHR